MTEIETAFRELQSCVGDLRGMDGEYLSGKLSDLQTLVNEREIHMVAKCAETTASLMVTSTQLFNHRGCSRYGGKDETIIQEATKRIDINCNDHH